MGEDILMKNEMTIKEIKANISPQEMKFLKYYLKTGNKAYAVAKAGYPISTKNGLYAKADKLLKGQYIILYISYMKDKVEAETIAGVQEVLQFYTDVLRGKIKEENLVQVTKKKNGMQITESEVKLTKAKIKDRLKAAEQLGKNYGLEENSRENTEFEDLTVLGDLLRGDN